MAGVTKVGPPELGDRYKRPNVFERIWRIVRWWRFLNWGFFPFNVRAAARVAEAEMALEDHIEEAERKHRHAGIPEADLTDEQREAAVRRMKDEEAIRRARGDR